MNANHKLITRLTIAEHLIAALSAREGVDPNLLQKWLCSSQDNTSSRQETQELGNRVFLAIKETSAEGTALSDDEIPTIPAHMIKSAPAS